MGRLVLWLGFLVLAVTARGADALPSKPAQYVSDRAGILSAQTVSELNARLAESDRTTSNQVLVATFPSIPDGYAMEDFTQRTAEAWGVGQKDRDNGAVLFVFPNDRKLRIEVGYGLEGALPDAVAKRIINNVITPAFRSGDFDGGVKRGVEAILQRISGEYESTDSLQNQNSGAGGGWVFLLFVGVFLVLMILGSSRPRKSTVYGPKGKRGWTGNWGGTGWGGGFGGGGGGFSGGGGSFGGGGASGGW